MKYILEKKKPILDIMVNICIIASALYNAIRIIAYDIVWSVENESFYFGGADWRYLYICLALAVFAFISIIISNKKKTYKPTAFLLSVVFCFVEYLSWAISNLEWFIVDGDNKTLIVFAFDLCLVLISGLTFLFVLLLEKKGKKAYKILSIIFCILLAVAIIAFSVYRIIMIEYKDWKTILSYIAFAFPASLITAIMMTINIVASYKLTPVVAPTDVMAQPIPVAQSVTQYQTEV